MPEEYEKSYFPQNISDPQDGLMNALIHCGFFQPNGDFRWFGGPDSDMVRSPHPTLWWRIWIIMDHHGSSWITMFVCHWYTLTIINHIYIYYIPMTFRSNIARAVLYPSPIFPLSFFCFLKTIWPKTAENRIPEFCDHGLKHNIFFPTNNTIFW